MTKGAFRLPISAGGSLPDPATYCPAAGYILDPAIYNPPIEFISPELSDESIILLCSNTGSNTIQLSGNGALTYTVYDSSDNIITSQNKATGVSFIYNFPTDVPNTYYKVKITPQVSNHISVFAVGTHTIYGKNQPIEAAILNCPYLTTALTMFMNLVSLKDCKIISTLDSCVSLDQMFYGTSILTFKFPPSLPVCSTINYLFYQSGIISIDFNNCNLPLLTTAAYVCQYCYSLLGVNVNITAPKLYDLKYFLANCFAATFAYFDFAISDISSTVNFSSLINSCSKLKYVIFPDFGNIERTINCNAMGGTLPELVEMTYRGDMYLTDTSPFSACNKLKKIRCTGNMRFASSQWNFGTNSTVDEVIFEKNVSGVLSSNNLTIRSLTIAGTQNLDSYAWQTYNMTSFNFPNMVCANSFWLLSSGLVASQFTEVVINWAACGFSGGTAGSPKVIVRATLTVAQLEAIWTLLPTVGVATYIEFKYSTNYAAANKTIATAKGYVFA